LSHHAKRRPLHSIEVEIRILLLHLNFETICLEYSKEIRQLILELSKKESNHLVNMSFSFQFVYYTHSSYKLFPPSLLENRKKFGKGSAN
jgi:hypothetical protein